jgi:Na+/proline symporter
VLSWPDYVVLAGSLVVLLAIGFWFTRRQRDTVDFFLARRRVPAWAVWLSFLATEISAVARQSGHGGTIGLALAFSALAPSRPAT